MEPSTKFKQWFPLDEFKQEAVVSFDFLRKEGYYKVGTYDGNYDTYRERQ